MYQREIETLLQRFIEFTEEHFEGSDLESIPVVHFWDLLPDFFNEYFDDLLREWNHEVRIYLRTYCLSRMDDALSNVVPRYAVIALYDCLIYYLTKSVWADKRELPAPPANSTTSSPEDPTTSRRGGIIVIEILTWTPHIELLKEDLKRVLDFVEPHKLSQWRDLGWEISDCCLVDYWDRAFSLFDRAAQVTAVSRNELLLLRGQLNFMLALKNSPNTNLQSDIVREGYVVLRHDTVLHPCNWQPQVYNAPDSLVGLLFFASGLGEALEDHQELGAKQPSLADAIHDLERASQLEALSPVYRAILARCYVAAGRTHEAAAIYEQINRQELEGEWSKLAPEVYRTTTSCYVAVGEIGKAIETLQLCSSKFPKLADIYLRTAELQGQEADFIGVKETIRKGTDNDAGLDQDWKLNAVLALGEFHPTSSGTLSFLKPNPEHYHVIVAMLGDYWPRFKGLSAKAKEQWVHGTFSLHFVVTQELLKPMQISQAHHTFVRALDFEMEEKVFRPVGRYFQDHRELYALITGSDRIESADSSWFCRFVKSRKSLSIGQKSKILDMCGWSDDVILIELRKWLLNNHPDLLTHAKMLGGLSRFRNFAEHEGGAIGEGVPEKCREVLESIR